MSEITVSHSQIMTWLMCKKYWQYNYVRGLVPTGGPDKRFEMGDYLHGKLDLFYQMMQRGFNYEEIPDLITQLILEDYKNDGTNGELILRSLKVFNRYCAEISPMIDNGIIVVESEYHFLIPMVTPKGREFNLEGYVDLLYQNKQRQYRVRDHKTHGSSAAFWSQEQADADVQQTTYIGGLRKAGIPVEGGEISEIVTYNFKDFAAQPLDKIYQRKMAFRSDAMIEASMNWYGQIVDEMFDEKQFTRSLTRGCAKCYYRVPCFTSFQGKDEDTIIRLGFKRKDGWSEWHASSPQPEICND